MAETPAILFSNLNLARSLYITRPLGWLGDFVKGAGYDGVEYTPVLPYRHTPRAIGRAVSRGSIDIRSLHATFRTTQQSQDLYPDPSKKEDHSPGIVERVLASPIGGLVMPDAVNSAVFMRRTQRRMGQRVPGIFYPLADRLGDIAQQETAGVSKALFQPMEHQVGLVNAATLYGFHTEMHDIRNYSYVIDTMHIRKRYGASEKGVLNDTEASVPFLAPYTNAMHLSLYRKDIPGEDHIPGLKEARDALQGKYTGELRDMIDVLKERGGIEYVVVEGTADALCEAAGATSIKDLQHAYRDIAEGFEDYWQAA